MSEAPTLLERFEGCLLGLGIGDALGGKFEGQDPEAIRGRFSSIDDLIQYPTEEIYYTDDTQMTIGVAETLIAHGEIIEEHLCDAFVANYLPSRGYGSGARAVLDAMEQKRDYHSVAEHYFPGGSLGNGAAMRVAPVGLFYYDDHPRLWDQARLSALPTHVHDVGVEGAQLLALAVAFATFMDEFDREAYLQSLTAMCITSDLQTRMSKASEITSAEQLASLGNGIKAVDSVPTAITAFALTPESYEETIGNCIFLGGDTDTIAAMAGALSGAYLGIKRLPSHLANLLESTPKGRDYLRQLASQLHDKRQS